MTLEGMDVDRAQALARQLDGYAQALAHISAALTGLAAELGHSWRGPASATFQQQCMAQYRPAFGNAAQALRDMHTHLVANIQQQVRASAADPGSSGAAVGGALGLGALLGPALAPGLHAVASAWDTVDKWDKRVELVKTPLEKLKDITSRDYDLHDPANREYGKVWTKLIKLDHESPFLKYKQDPVLLWLHDDKYVRGAGRILVKWHVAGLLERLSPVGTALGWISVGVDLWHAGEDVANRRYAAAGGELVNATADALQNSDNPALFLAGVGIKLLKDDYDRDPGMFNAALRPSFDSLPGHLAGPLQKAFL